VLYIPIVLSLFFLSTPYSRDDTFSIIAYPCRVSFTNRGPFFALLFFPPPPPPPRSLRHRHRYGIHPFATLCFLSPLLHVRVYCRTLTLFLALLSPPWYPVPDLFLTRLCRSQFILFLLSVFSFFSLIVPLPFFLFFPCYYSRCMYLSVSLLLVCSFLSRGFVLCFFLIFASYFFYVVPLQPFFLSSLITFCLLFPHPRTFFQAPLFPPLCFIVV